MSDRIVGSTVIATERLDALLAERDAALARIATLEAALRPFADAYRAAVKELPWPVDAPMWEAAAAALADAPGEGP